LAAAPIAALVLGDWLYPRHSGLLLAVHPVRLIYAAARRAASASDSYAAGLLIVAGLWLAPTATVAFALGALHSALGPLAWAAAAFAVLKFSAALRLLLIHAAGAAEALERGDLDSARLWVSGIVRRRVEGLPPELVASAAIESVAENLVDGYTGPLTYYPLAGPAGSFAFRAANTLDGAIGYRVPGLERVGAPSAHLDTLLAFAPARLTAALIVALAPLAGGSAAGALRSWLRYRGATPSLNAGHPIAAMAGALGVRLEKRGVYVVNPEGRPPGPGDVRRACRLALLVAAAYTLLAAAAAAAVSLAAC
jgi:adenosylcobinamide-phosphate synthase